MPCHIVHFAKLRTWSIPSPLTMSSYAKNLNNLLICRICYLLQMMKMFCRLTQHLQLSPAITINKSCAKKNKTSCSPFFYRWGSPNLVLRQLFILSLLYTLSQSSGHALGHQRYKDTIRFSPLAFSISKWSDT